MGRVILSGASKGMMVSGSYPKNFADATWAQIIDACHTNKVPATWAVGNQKPMIIDGTAYIIDIIGKNHDDYADGSGKAPLTFQLHECYGEKKQMNSSNTNKGGWTSCAMRTTHLPAILAKMPTEVQSGIREVNKLTLAGGGSTTINTTADKLFPLSEIEVFGAIHYSYAGEGKQYEYYTAGGSKVKNYNGSAIGWWERSPKLGSVEDFCVVTNNGNTIYAGASSTAHGVSFGFCF